MSKNRREKIVELISNNVVETQEELQELLKQSGYDVTQSTVSRDIKQLHLFKASDGKGHYCYRVSTAKDNFAIDNVRYKETFKNTVVSIENAMNDVVVKCYTGMANAACVVIDAMFSDFIVGSLAGEDTIFIITRSEKDATELVRELNNLL